MASVWAFLVGSSIREVTEQSGHSMRDQLSIFVAKHRRLMQRAFIACFSLVFGMLSLSVPILEWDMLAYVANATKYLTQLPFSDIHEIVYAQLAESVSAEDYSFLVASESRTIIAADHEAFRQTSQFFYDARIVYIGLLSGLMHLGMDPFFASYFISTICMIVCIFLLANLLPVTLPYGVCFSIPFIAFAFGLFELARFSSPDALAALVTVFMYWLLFRGNWFLLILLPASIFVRTDLIIIAVFFLGYLYMTARFSRKWVLLSSFATIGAYLVLNNYIVDGDPWSSLIGYNFGTKPTHPETYSFVVTLENYLSYLWQGIRSFSYEPRFFVFGALVVIGIFMFSARFVYHPEQRVSVLHQNLLFLIVSSVLYVGAHFLLFPVNWIRFYAAQYALVAVVVFWAALMLLAQQNYSTDADAEIIKP